MNPEDTIVQDTKNNHENITRKIWGQLLVLGKQQLYLC